MEKRVEFNKEMHLDFLNYKKTFNRVYQILPDNREEGLPATFY